MDIAASPPIHQNQKGDHLNIPGCPSLMKIVSKHGDKDILFSDKVMKFTASGKIKRRILLITDVAMYLIDPETNKLKRRVALTAVKKLCLSKLSDGFFAVIVPCEYDCLMLSTRKKQIVDVLIESCSSTSEEMVEFSNSFAYRANANLVKEIHFEDQEGNVRTRIVRREIAIETAWFSPR